MADLYDRFPDILETLDTITGIIMEQDLGLMDDGEGGRKRTNNPREDPYDILYHNVKLIFRKQNSDRSALLPFAEGEGEVIEEPVNTLYDQIEEHRDELDLDTIRAIFELQEDMMDENGKIIRNIQMGGKRKTRRRRISKKKQTKHRRR